MSQILCAADGVLAARRPRTAAIDLARRIADFLLRMHPPVMSERRQRDRAALPLVLRLTPLDELGQPIEAETMLVTGKDITTRGVGFFHERPVAFRRAHLSFDHPTAGRFHAEVDLRWCRFTQSGWYESGGRLLRLVPEERAA
jgi:hypothetical protein